MRPHVIAPGRQADSRFGNHIAGSLTAAGPGRQAERRETKMRAYIVGLVLAAATPANAQDLIDAGDPAGVLAIAGGYGDAVLTKDGMGDPMVEGSIGGKEYLLYFYDCSENRNCKSLMFSASWEVEEEPDVTRMADWNREKRFGKAFLDEDGSAVVEMNVNLRGGVTRVNLDDTIDWWRLVLDEFADHIGAR